MSQYLIGTVTVGAGGQATIDFSNVPQTFTDLMLTYSTRDNGNPNTYPVAGVDVSFNGVSTNRSARLLYGSGSGSAATGTYSTFPTWEPTSVATSSTFSNVTLYIPNYTSSNNKTFLTDGATENNAAMAYVYSLANLWSSTAAITRVTIAAESGTFAQYSTASLYGIKNADKYYTKATGGVITSDANYVYHIFSASGTFTPTTALAVDALVVAGGGGGGIAIGGGGGAGGYQAFVNQSLSATPYTITIGAGGGGAVNQNTDRGSSGANSQFGSLTASVGGGGGTGQSYLYPNGTGAVSGGSGGGGARNNTNPGSGTAGQGNAGGNGSNTASGYGSGGGGGAGAVGANGSGTSGGAGGAGLTWLNGVTYAGGGGGVGDGNTGFASGGTGGGGAGGAAGYAATANTGGGGGGSSGGTGNTGGAGGSGIVVIRYAK